MVNQHSPLDELLPLLQTLDQALIQAIALAQKTYGVDMGEDGNRGLYISDQDVARSLAREPGMPLFPIPWEDVSARLRQNCRFSQLQDQFCLSDFDLALVVIALAPEIDLRYEQLYAYLQDDVTRRHPSANLALNLLCVSADEKLRHRSHLANDAPLMRHGLLTLLPDPHSVDPPFLAYHLKVDPQITRFLLGQPGLDARLAAFCQWIQPTTHIAELWVELETQSILQQVVGRFREDHQPLNLYVQGVPGIGKRQIAAAIATELQRSLLIADLPRALSLNIDIKPLLGIIRREAQLQNSVLYFPGVDRLHSQDQGVLHQRLLEELIDIKGVTILGGSEPWIPTTPYRSGVMAIAIALPDFSQRRTCWQNALLAAGIPLELQALDILAERFRLTPEQITDAVINVRNQGRYGQASDLFTAARKQSGYELRALTNPIQPRYQWSDIVLPPNPLAQLKELCSQVKYRPIVYGKWGFDRKLSLGKGVNALFSGPPGTGKTMAAEVIATELELDLYRIDLSQIVSKYIGETEKNLDRIFKTAETANAILFFDEADALFGKRSEVKDAHDRYANIEVGYLLQKMEEYEGLAILATNLRQNLDDAFVRRLHFIVEFPFPDENHRRQIWHVMFPPEAPLDRDVDFGILSREIKLSGGNLKNIALAAAFYAADDGGMIQMAHLIQAAHREHQKAGYTWQPTEWPV